VKLIRLMCDAGNIYKDAAATQRVATIKAGADDALFKGVNLVNGVIICQA
jgi:hypothetical protein